MPWQLRLGNQEPAPCVAQIIFALATRLSHADEGGLSNPRLTNPGALKQKFSLGESSEQGFRLLEIGGLEPFGEPAINLPEELPGCGALALVLPQPTEAHGGA